MPLVCQFDTATVRPASEPRVDTQAAVSFSRPLVARPRLPHGINLLDVDKNANIRAYSAVSYCTNAWANCHITAWHDTILYGGISNILVLTPADLDFLTGEHMRGRDDAASVRVNFERQFVTPPNVVVFLNYIDLGHDRNWRLDVSASNIDTHGFTLHIDTWGDTILHGARACWVAYPEDRPHIFSTSVNTMDIRPVTQPRHEQSKNVMFDGVEFLKDPSVFVALNSLNVDCKANLRVKGYVSGVSKTGLVCHIDSWWDTVLYAAGVSIIAFN